MIFKKGLRFIKKIIIRLLTKIIDLRDKEVDIPLAQSLGRYDSRNRVLLNIPIEKCRTQVWNTLEINGSPFVQTIVDYDKKKVIEYGSSALESYYSKYQPKSASEVLKITNNKTLDESPALGYVFPWDEFTPEEMIRKRKRVALSENHAIGSALDLSYGHTDFGPVSIEKGKIEFYRLIETFKSIKERGYIEKPYLSDGGIRGYFLVAEEDWCFIIKAGKHRSYALSALGYDSIPVILDTSFGTVECRDIPYWRQVINGTFTEEEASIFVNKMLNVKYLNSDHLTPE